MRRALADVRRQPQPASTPRLAATPRSAPERPSSEDQALAPWPPRARPLGLNRWDLWLYLLLVFAAALLGALLAL